MSLIFKVVDNDCKGELGTGTIYEAEYDNGSIKTMLRWTALDELNKTEVYKKFLECRNDWANHKNEILKCNDAAVKQAKEDNLKSEFNSYMFSDAEIECINNIIEQHPKEIEQYKLSNLQKVINPLIGKLIKTVNAKPHIIVAKLIELINSK